MTSKNSGNGDGRGRSEGSRKTQFAAGNQAARNRGRAKNKPLPDNAVERLRGALFQEVTSIKGGKKRKTEYIDGFFQTLMADVLKAPIADRLKFYKVIVDSGIMDVEEYKKRLTAKYQKWFDQQDALLMRMELMMGQSRDYLMKVGLERSLYKLAFDNCCLDCTCGAAETAYKNASAHVSAETAKKKQELIEALEADEDEREADLDSQADEAGSSHGEQQAAQDGVAPDDAEPDDDEFYAGMGGARR